MHQDPTHSLPAPGREPTPLAGLTLRSPAERARSFIDTGWLDRIEKENRTSPAFAIRDIVLEAIAAQGEGKRAVNWESVRSEIRAAMPALLHQFWKSEDLREAAAVIVFLGSRMIVTKQNKKDEVKVNIFEPNSKDLPGGIYGLSLRILTSTHAFTISPDDFVKTLNDPKTFDRCRSVRATVPLNVEGSIERTAVSAAPLPDVWGRDTLVIVTDRGAPGVYHTDDYAWCRFDSNGTFTLFRVEDVKQQDE